ncbi:hypothetical protein IAR55_001559 [Kwoniella newhampshirensis]|uniref:Uncharacterized protein n=1 Tax=Kwoniella newhampshirensis TaxID=1651941 RepID=A0AAW0Z2H2_9TREE
MRSFAVLAAVVPAAMALPTMAGLSISGPDTLSSCSKSTYTWTLTYPPYTLSTYDYSHSTGTPSLLDEPVVIPSHASATWILDVQPGRNISVMVVDAKGNSAETYPRVVGVGKVDCLAQTWVPLPR